MSDYFLSTLPRSGQDVRVLTVDSKDALLGTTTDEPCEFTAYLYEPIRLTAATEIYLESIWIGGFKINHSNNYHFSGDGITDVVHYFSIQIPEFEIDNLCGEYNTPADLAANNGSRNIPAMQSRFNLPNEQATRTSDQTMNITNTKPFILGHLSKTAIYVGSVKPKTISKISVSIKDQDGLSIFSAPTASIPNPHSLSRRIIMQFRLVEV